MRRTSITGTISWARVATPAVLLAAVFACSFASTAGAQVVTDKLTGLKLGILRPPSLAVASGRSKSQKVGFAGTLTCDNRKTVGVDPNCAHPLTYHGGPVQHAENDYLFFWDPNGFSSAPTYEAGMAQWLNDLAGGDLSPGHVTTSVGNPVSVTQEYYDLSGPGKTKRYVSYDVTNSGTIMDTDPYPANGCIDKYTPFNSHTPVTLGTCLTQAQLIHELSHYMTTHSNLHLPSNLSTEYFILTPPNVGGCSDSTTSNCAIAQFCAYHSIGGTGANPILYAFMPYLQSTNCDVNQARGFTNLYSSGIDAVVGTFSHELSETMTDPELNGWSYTGGGSIDEIGDKCAYQYEAGVRAAESFTALPKVGSTPYNATLGSDNYLLQEEYDNAHGGCNQWDTYAQPTGGTVNAPSTATTGAAATFSVSGVVSTGVAYVKWLFGDGSTATSVGTAAINRYYQAPGSYAATAIVTDTHGNEVKETAASSVSVAAPTTPQLQSAVNAVISPAGAGAKIGNLLSSGGYTFTFSTLAAGTFHMVWKHGTTVVATITKALSILGPNRLKIALTGPGHNLLAHANTLSIASSDSYNAPSVPPPVSGTANLNLTR